MAEKVYVLEKNPMGSIYTRVSYSSILRISQTLYVVLSFYQNALDSLCRY
jgi:hypothetical protein